MYNEALAIARIFGPFLVIWGIWIFLNRDQMAKVTNNFKTTPALVYLISIFNLLVGFVILSQYDLWDWNLFLFVTLLGWAMVVRGIMGLFATKLFLKMCIGKGHLSKKWTLIPIIVGIILSYLGLTR